MHRLVIMAAVGLVVALGIVALPHRAGAATPTVAYSFFAYGDFRPNDGSPTAAYPVGWQHVAAKMGSIPHAFDVVAGDMIQGLSGTDTLTNDLAKYDNLFKRLGADAPFNHVWAPGNHEDFGSAGYRQAYDTRIATAHWHGFSYGNATATNPRVRVISLSTVEPGNSGRLGYYGESDTRNSAQAKWLVSFLKAHAFEANTYLIAVFHHPLADPKPNEGYATNGERVRLETLFTRYGVDLVINAHVHAYVRHTMPNGTPYLVDGNAGASLYGESSYQHTTPGVDAKKVFGKYGFVRFYAKSDGTLSGLTYAVTPSTWTWDIVDRFSVPQKRPTFAP